MAGVKFQTTVRNGKPKVMPLGGKPSEAGAGASAVMYSIVETAKANNLNIFQYLYTVLLYMPDYMNSSAGIEQLMPWSEFIKEQCSGLIDVESNVPEKEFPCRIGSRGSESKW